MQGAMNSRTMGYNSQSGWSGIWSYLLLSSSALPHLFPPTLPLPGLPGALEIQSIKEKLTQEPDNSELQRDCSCFVFLSAVCGLSPYSFPLRSGVVMSLSSISSIGSQLRQSPKPNRALPYKLQDQPKIIQYVTFLGAFNLDTHRSAPTREKGE